MNAIYEAERTPSRAEQNDRIKALENLVTRLIGVFGACPDCVDGCDENGDACHRCGGCGEVVRDHGVLLAEIRPDARALLEPQ